MLCGAQTALFYNMSIKVEVLRAINLYVHKAAHGAA